MSEQAEDSIARTKKILNMVDGYHYCRDSNTRAELRGALMDYFTKDAATIAEQKRTIESLEIQNTALRGVFSREEELQATITNMEAREKRLVVGLKKYGAISTYYHEIEELLNPTQDKESPESDIDQATRLR